jgi:hypothetical protein
MGLIPIVITTVSVYGSVSPRTGHATVAVAVVSIEFSAQLLLVESPLPMFFCFISCSVFVPLWSPSSVAYADVENIPVNAAVIKAEAMAIVLFIVLSNECDYI